ncbi:zinc finger MYND domain-containing protein 19-like [Oppia nitens]|uniref:zinc finger MYND domain-containing protein 19-like n=1 Tax=Oppia nitens TaxID=1686743 RepID=UPI0023DC72C8|nr:zinc finger MYND domain-containing protein 19-like [Oppia nitens]
MKDLSQSSTSRYHQLSADGSSSASGQTAAELWPIGVKLGIVRLGRVAGKLKYTLLDERDIVLAREYSFEARLEIDRNGNGAVIYAVAFTTTAANGQQRRGGRQSTTARYLQDLIWESHYGPIPHRTRVVHRNCISMDNRLDNLCVVPIGDGSHLWYNCLLRQHNHHHQQQQLNHQQENQHHQQQQPQQQSNPQNKSSPNNHQMTLYWAAIQQLPPEHIHTELQLDNSTIKSMDVNGDVIVEDDDMAYYECHYGPCCRLESEPKQFSICGRCQLTRYCGTQCQQRDWPSHKRYCREKPNNNNRQQRVGQQLSSQQTLQQQQPIIDQNLATNSFIIDR